MRKAVFFDRDGVLNVDKSYLGFIKDFEWMDGAKEALAYLTAEGYAIIVVTNQSGVARGYYTEDDVKVLHDWMCREAAKAGGIITAVYYCPYLEGAPFFDFLLYTLLDQCSYILRLHVLVLIILNRL